MSIRAAMRVLSDEQLMAVHENAQAMVAQRLGTGYVSILGTYTRQARAAEREIIARGRHADARNHIPKLGVESE